MSLVREQFFIACMLYFVATVCSTLKWCKVCMAVFLYGSVSVYMYAHHKFHHKLLKHWLCMSVHIAYSTSLEHDLYYIRKNLISLCSCGMSLKRKVWAFLVCMLVVYMTIIANV